MFQSVRIASRSAVLTLLAALFACLPLSVTAGTTAARGDILVVTVHGTVSATMAGVTAPLSAGAILQLPVTVRTGADGAVELRQGNSTFAAASNTEWEIPESAAADGLVERIVQIRGNAFYNIGKRSGTRLRVEAPYLVAVIKGTQFNVAAQEDSTTIALYEGHLEVRASDDSDVVDLNAGEIAIRRRNEVSISVLRMNFARAESRRNQELAARPQTGSTSPTSDTATARNDTVATRPRLETSTANDDGSVVSTVSPVPEREQVVEAPPDARVAINTKTELTEVARVDTGLDTTVDLISGTAAASIDVSADVGSVSTDIGAGASVDIPAGAGAVEVGADATVAAGDVTAVDVGAAAAVDVPAGTVDVGLDTTVASTDVGATVGVDAGAGDLGAAVDVGPVDVGVDIGSGGVDLDLGLSTSDEDTGLLGGLLGRKREN